MTELKMNFTMKALTIQYASTAIGKSWTKGTKLLIILSLCNVASHLSIFFWIQESGLVKTTLQLSRSKAVIIETWFVTASSPLDIWPSGFVWFFLTSLGKSWCPGILLWFLLGRMSICFLLFVHHVNNFAFIFYFAPVIVALICKCCFTKGRHRHCRFRKTSSLVCGGNWIQLHHALRWFLKFHRQTTNIQCYTIQYEAWEKYF